MKLLSLNYGPSAIVDDEDYAWLLRWKWNFDHGYASRRIYKSYEMVDGKRKMSYGKLYMHRAIMKPAPSQTIDHEDGNGLNNQKSNLRICNMAENTANRTKQYNNTSGYKGVYWHKKAKKWCAEIRADGKKYYLGLFPDKRKAAEAYNGAARTLHKSFAKENIL